MKLSGHNGACLSRLRYRVVGVRKLSEIVVNNLFFKRISQRIEA